LNFNKLQYNSIHFRDVLFTILLTLLVTVSCNDADLNLPDETQLDLDVIVTDGLTRAISLIDNANLNLASATLDSLTTLLDTYDRPDLEVQIVAQKALILSYQGRLDDAIMLLTENLPAALEHGTPKIQFLYYLRIASANERLGNGHVALEFINRATEIPQNQLTTNEIFGALITKAGIYSENKLYAESIDLYQKAISMADTSSVVSPGNLGVAHNNLGLLLHNLGRYEDALEMYKSSISINTNANNKLGLSLNLNNIANAHKALGNLDMSIEYLLQAVDVNKTVQSSTALVRNYYNLGDTYLSIGEVKLAEEYFTLAYNLSKQESFYPGVMYNANGLAKIQLEKDLPRQAITFAIESLDLALQLKTIEIEVSLYATLSKAYEQVSDFRNALEYQRKFQSLQDTITTNRNKRDIEEVRSSYQFELLSNQNDLLEQQVLVYELRVRRQVLFLVLLLIVIISIATILYVINRNKKNIDLKNKQLEILNSEKDTLTNVIVHDLRNPLTGLLGSLELLSEDVLTPQQTELITIALKSTRKVSEMIDGLLDVSRMKDEHIDEAIKLTDIKHICTDTIELFKPKAKLRDIRISSRLENITVVSHPPYISRILGNLLSNALKFSDKGSLIYIETSIDTLQKVWRMKVADQGQGFSEIDKESAFQMFQRLSAEPQNGENSSGLGLYTVSLLIQKLGGTVWIENNTPKGAIIVCEFPMPETA
jgi:signal transduction histidine kinase